MSRFTIRSGGEKFTKEEILKQKDFEQFLTAYRKHAFLASAGKITFGIIATGMIISVLMLSTKNNVRSDQDDGTKKTSFVSPPLKGVTIPYESYTVDASKGGVLKYKTGTELNVPPFAFLGKDGKPVTGTVTLRYREFHDPADFFLSGIPMTYDSAGTRYHFESAGMMELLAFSGPDAVKVNPKAKINVNMASKQQGDYFNVYYLDSNKRNWDFIKRDTAGIHTNKLANNLNDRLKKDSPEKIRKDLKKDIAELNTKIANIEKTKPVSPERSDPGTPKIKLDVLKDEFPEVAAYDGVFFQVDPYQYDFKPESASAYWDNVTIDRTKKTERYLITVSKGKEKHSFGCHPVLEGKDYDNAENIFEKLHDKYLSLLDEHTKKVKEKQKQLELLHKIMKNRNDIMNDSMATAGRMTDAMSEKQNAVIRVFEVSKFGFYNCDCPSALPKGMLVNAVFVDSNGKTINLEHAYLVEKGRNAMFTYYSYGFNQFRYDPSKQNMIWAIAPGNKLAVFNVASFKKLKIDPKYTEFTLKLTDRSFASVIEAKQYLQI